MIHFLSHHKERNKTGEQLSVSPTVCFSGYILSVSSPHHPFQFSNLSSTFAYFAPVRRGREEKRGGVNGR